MSNLESVDSLYDLYENCDPALLKRTREISGMDDSVLARTACLSVAQVRQLETGGDGLFYSITIKRQAYKRLMMILGAQPPLRALAPQVAEMDSVSELHDSAGGKQTIDSIVALSSKSDYLVSQPVKDFVLDLRHRIQEHRQTLGALMLLCLAVGLFVLNWPGTTPIPVAAAVAPQPAASAVTLPAASVAQSLPAATVSVPAPVPSAPASAMVATTSAASPGAACAFVAEPLTQVMPPSAPKDARYVYLLSSTEIDVCVVDGAKKPTLLHLKAGEGRSVYGASPWQISAASLQKMQIYFQGSRVLLPESGIHRVSLVEKTATAQ